MKQLWNDSECQNAIIEAAKNGCLKSLKRLNEFFSITQSLKKDLGNDIEKEIVRAIIESVVNANHSEVVSYFRSSFVIDVDRFMYQGCMLRNLCVNEVAGKMENLNCIFGQMNKEIGDFLSKGDFVAAESCLKDWDKRLSDCLTQLPGIGLHAGGIIRAIFAQFQAFKNNLS